MTRAVGVVGDAAFRIMPVIEIQIPMSFVIELGYPLCEIAVRFRLAPRQRQGKQGEEG